MITPATLELLRRDAGMSGDSRDPASVSGAVAGGDPVDAAVDSFIGALQRLTVELNGPKPSGVVANQEGDGVSRAGGLRGRGGRGGRAHAP